MFISPIYQMSQPVRWTSHFIFTWHPYHSTTALGRKQMVIMDVLFITTGSECNISGFWISLIPSYHYKLFFFFSLTLKKAGSRFYVRNKQRQTKRLILLQVYCMCLCVCVGSFESHHFFPIKMLAPHLLFNPCVKT